MRKKIPISQMIAAKEAEQKALDINFYPFNYSEMWAIEALKYIDRLPLEFYPYDSRQHYSNFNLYFSLHRHGRYAHKTLKVSSFFELFKAIAIENCLTIEKDFFVDLREYRQKSFDRFISEAIENNLLSSSNMGILDTVRSIETILSNQRKFKADSPNNSHPRAKYLSKIPSVIFSGQHRIIPAGIAFEFGYRGNGGWCYNFLGDVAPDMHNWPKSKDRDFLKSLLRISDFLKKETEPVNFWNDLWNMFMKHTKEHGRARFHPKGGHLFFGKDFSEELFSEQKAILSNFCQAKEFLIGSKRIRPVPIKDDFWGQGYTLKVSP